MVNGPLFHYQEAFRRNHGWVTEWEQQVLRGKRVAIAGAGGVGGFHLLTLARLGIGAFHIADMDCFELANFNRQAGAFTDTIGKEKAAVMANMARSINPEADIRIFPEGVTEKNLDEFLKGVDLFIDGFDAFVIDMRVKTFARCAELSIPAITAGPNGMGSGYLVFMPGQMTFEEYFRLEGLPLEKKYASWFLSQVPGLLHMPYLVEPCRMDLLNKRAPSVSPACMLASGIAGIEAVKILLGRGKVYPAPYYQQFDAYRGKYIRRKLRGGNRNLLQRLKIYYVSRVLLKKGIRNARPADSPPPDTPLMRILDAARWTPSGDNSQPWNLQIADDDTVRVYLSTTDKDTLNIRGAEPSLLSVGMMIAIMTIAAAAEGKALRWKYVLAENTKDGKEHRFDISFTDSAKTDADSLYSFIPLRHTDRRHYRTTPLTDAQKRALEDALSGTLGVHWLEGRKRREVGTLNMEAMGVRMRSEAAYRELANCLDWEHPFSESKLPVHTLPLTALSRAVMRFVMESWTRMKLLGMIPGALLPSAIETELMPALRCGAHFLLSRQSSLPQEEEKRIAAVIAEGRALMRFWLTLTKLGLVMQPTFSPIVFSHYGLHPEELSLQDQRLASRCRALARRVEQLWGAYPDRVVFMGRIGVPKSTAVASRSLRKPLEDIVT